jgi:hypothetical protein
MKTRNIILLIIVIILFSFDAIGSNGFFCYRKLCLGVKLAIEDFTKINNNDTILVMNTNKEDSLTFTLDGNESSIMSFIDNPPLYYSIHEKHIVLIYNGDEKKYNPNPSELATMFDFLSKFIDTSEFVKCDWENYIFSIKLKQLRSDVYDQAIIQYKINNDSIIKKEIFYDSKHEDYFKRRFKPKYIIIR